MDPERSMFPLMQKNRQGCTISPLEIIPVTHRKPARAVFRADSGRKPSLTLGFHRTQRFLCVFIQKMQVNPLSQSLVKPLLQMESMRDGIVYGNGSVALYRAGELEGGSVS